MRIGINLNNHGVNAAGRSAAFRPKIRGCFQAGFGAGFDRATQWIGRHRQLAQLDSRFRHAFDPHFAIAQFQIIFRNFQLLTG